MERAHTLYGLLVCATTTILVFGILATSTIPVLRHRLDRLCGIVLLPALHRADGKGEGACLRINDR